MATLRDYQEEAVAFLQPLQRGFIHAPAGSGKTIIAAHAAARRARPGWRVTWLANTREQVEQGIAAIQGTEGPEGVEFDVCCVAAQPDVSDSDLIIFDEAHHAPAATWEALLRQAKPSAVVWGFSATPWTGKPDRDEPVEQAFKNFFIVERERVEASGHLIKGKVYVHDLDQPGQFDEAINRKVEGIVDQRMRRYPLLHDVPKVMGLHSRVKALARQIEAKVGAEKMAAASAGRYSQDELQALGIADLVEKAIQTTEERNKLVREEHTKRAKWQVTQEHLQTSGNRNAAVTALANQEIAAGESVIVLVASIEHGEKLAASIPRAVLVHSKLGAKDRRARIAGLRDGSIPCIVATSLCDEGLDVPRASRLILVAGGRSASKVEQRAGRVLRLFDGKNGGIIHDFADAGALFANQQAKARVRTYRQLGYEVTPVPYARAAA